MADAHAIQKLERQAHIMDEMMSSLDKEMELVRKRRSTFEDEIELERKKRQIVERKLKIREEIDRDRGSGGGVDNARRRRVVHQRAPSPAPPRSRSSAIRYEPQSPTLSDADPARNAPTSALLNQFFQPFVQSADESDEEQDPPRVPRRHTSGGAGAGTTTTTTTITTTDLPTRKNLNVQLTDRKTASSTAPHRSGQIPGGAGTGNTGNINSTTIPRPNPFDRACVKCYRGHRACDRERPSCNACRRSGQECVYFEAGSADDEAGLRGSSGGGGGGGAGGGAARKSSGQADGGERWEVGESN